MASLTYLDTHVLVWLYAGEIQRMPAPVLTALEKDDLLISPMVLVELQYLVEIERFTDPVERVVELLRREVGLRVCDLPFQQVAQRALEASWTRDAFDRLIVSQASIKEAPLLTKDRQIHANYPRAVWSS